MILAALVLWAGVPLGCLWLGLAGAGLERVARAGAARDGRGVRRGRLASALRLLTWLNLQHIHARERRGLESYGNVTLEGVMATTATPWH